MSISLNNSSIPVDSHPLSPEDLESTGRSTRRRPRRKVDKTQVDAKPLAGYFSFKQPPKSEDGTLKAFAHNTYTSHHTSRANVDWNGSVRGFAKRKPTEQHISKEHLQPPEATVSTRASTLSLVWDRPSVPFFIVGSSKQVASSDRSLTTPPGTPLERPIFTLSPADGPRRTTLHGLPARAASHVLSTPFHSLDDSRIQSAISDLSVLSEEEEVNVTHPYHSALRVLSEAVAKLSKARVELEQGRRVLLEKQAKIRDVMLFSDSDSIHMLRESVLNIINDRQDDSLKDSLSVALSEDLTPTVNDNIPSSHSPTMSITPPDEASEFNSKINITSLTKQVLSSEVEDSLFTPIDQSDRGSIISDTHQEPLIPSPQSAPRVPPMRLKTRADSSTSLASGSLGDWMGWFGKGTLARAQDKQPAKAESSDQASDEVDNSLTITPKSARARSKSTMRLVGGMLNVFRPGSSSPHPQTPSSPAATAVGRPGHKRKASITISTKSLAPSVVNSPILGTFTLPPPTPILPIALSPGVDPQAVEHRKEDDVKTLAQHSVASAAASVFEAESASLLSSSRSPIEHTNDESARMQGSSLRALSNATRVMSSEPSSILVDHGHDVGELVTRLAWELIVHVRDSGVVFKEPVKPKAKSRPSLAAQEPSPEAENDQIAEGSRKAITRHTTRALSISGSAGAMLEKARRTSALSNLASPLLGGFGVGASKPRPSSTNLRDDISATSSTAFAAPGGPSVVTPPAMTTGTLPVALESIIPATAKPPTHYLSRTYTSLTSPDFKPPSSFGGFIGDRFATRQDTEGREPITDRFGFVYEVSSYDVLLLDRALRASNSAPGCLTGIKVADREEDDDWPAEDDTSRAREFEVIRGVCDCVDGVRVADHVEADEGRLHGSGNSSEVASVLSNSSSKRSKRVAESKHRRTLALSSPLKIANLDFLPSTEDGALVPTHACPNTVHTLVARMTTMHDKKQAKLKAEWGTFLRARRETKPIKALTHVVRSTAASSGAAAILGLGSHGGQDVEELRQSEGLVGFAQMGLLSNQNERKEFGRLVQGGIPLVYRAKVWLECSGALEMAEPGVFRDLLEEADREGGLAILEIEKDVGRTMPLNVFFGGDGVGVDKLRRVLRAYSRRNPAVGYCQGMNLVASTLLLVHADEEDAFWNLAYIIEKSLPEDFFSPSLLVSRACPLVLLDYVHDLMPAFFEHLMELEVDLPAICFSWFLSLFTDCLPVETLFRVWDVFLVEGLDVLFRIALSILRLNEVELLQAKSIPALYVVLESLPTRMWEVDKLLKYEVELRSYVVKADIIKKRDARVKELRELSA
ncbi:rab-GTPase-TBC domain-containing protein [Hysterangium stoloniferum]|nr:rab-GTPase-TBC domain-containing protein [Hysterangium stoloniferum]